MQLADTTRALVPIEVPLIEWPADDAWRTQLAGDGRPRLLVVAESADPPVCVDELEDWVRHPVDMVDVVARISTLRLRAQRRARVPVLDEHGLLWMHGRWVSIPQAQQPLMAMLVTRVGHVVATAELRAAYAEVGGSVDAVALKAAMSRLARRLAPLGLRLHNIPGRGSLLELCEVMRS